MDGTSVTEVAVLFADLAGFTALTEAHGDEQAADAAVRLLELTHAAYDGQALLVKGLGDGVMVVFGDIEQGVTGGLALARAVRAEPDFPRLRAGVHAGQVVWRDGDVFGSTVNIAARVTDRAAPGQVLITGEVHRALSGHFREEFTVIDLGAVPLRGVPEPIELIELNHRDRRTGRPIDPVCRMQVEAAGGAIMRTVSGVEFGFCSEPCARLFDEHPDKYM